MSRRQKLSSEPGTGNIRRGRGAGQTANSYATNLVARENAARNQRGRLDARNYVAEPHFPGGIYDLFGDIMGMQVSPVTVDPAFVDGGAAARRALDWNVDNWPDIRSLGEEVNRFSFEEFDKYIEDFFPERGEILDLRSENIKDMLKGKIPLDVQFVVQSAAVRRAGGTGQSTRASNIQALDLGLTSLALIEAGIGFANEVDQYTSGITAGLMQPGMQASLGSMVTPGFMLESDMFNANAQMETDRFNAAAMMNTDQFNVGTYVQGATGMAQAMIAESTLDYDYRQSLLDAEYMNVMREEQRRAERASRRSGIRSLVGTVAGAAVGTLLVPGAGTAWGAALGGAIGGGAAAAYDGNDIATGAMMGGMTGYGIGYGVNAFRGWMAERAALTAAAPITPFRMPTRASRLTGAATPRVGAAQGAGVSGVNWA